MARRESLPASTWLVLISASLLLMLSFGYRSSFGLFTIPLSEARGWGREVISFSLAIQNLFWGVISVVAGGLADRYGNLKVILVGVLVYTAGLYGMSIAESPAEMNTYAGLFVGSGIAGTGFGLILPAMARAVPEHRRQFALGLGSALGSFGQFAVLPVVQWWIDAFGWQQSLQLLSLAALFLALLAFPLAPFSGAEEAKKSPLKDQSVTEALSEAFSQPSFLLLTAGFFVCGFHISFISTHFPAYLSDEGFTAQIGAWSIAIIGLCNVIGAFMAGVLSGRFPKRILLVYLYSLRALAFFVFLITPASLVSIFVFSAALGVLWLATVPLTSGLVATIFGTRYMALLYGVVFLGHQIGAFTGIFLGGWLFEQHGNYDLVWWLGIALGIFAALIHLPIKETSIRQPQKAKPFVR